MEERRFNSRQRAAFFLAQNGLCAKCGTPLLRSWHADHISPWSHGGPTDTVNGQGLCASCNLKKGSKEEYMDERASKSEWPQWARDWQISAWEKYLLDKKNDWLLCATPGAGKTKWALHLARYMLDHKTVDRVVIVAPTQTIRDQWTDQTLVKLESVQNEHGGLENQEDFEGIAVTYAQVASQPDLQRMGCKRRTFVIFDEIHHAGFPQRLWGDKAKYAFESSIRRIGLTGTPWRRPGSGQIPFVNYDEQDGKVRVDFGYEYGEAVRDEVCRTVEFRAFNGEVQYVYLDSCAQKSVSYTLEDEDDTTSILRDLLKPDGEWMHSMIENAVQELDTIRRGDDGEDAIPDAKGLVIADNQADARIIGKKLEKMIKEKVEVIISDEADSEEALDRFKHGKGKWAVAVNKVSEGVDVPALYVGVYATRKKTPLIFRQIVGRFVRRRVNKDGKPRIEEERSAVLFMPAVASLKDLASDIESELRHTVDVEREEYEQERQAEQRRLDFDNRSADDIIEALPTDISPAELDVVIMGGKSYMREEYERAQELARQEGFGSDDVIRLANLIRKWTIPSSDHITPPPSSPNENKVPVQKFKKTLLRQVEQMARKKALALHIDHKEFNLHLVKRFGKKRRDLSVKQLENVLHWLDQLDNETWNGGTI